GSTRVLHSLPTRRSSDLRLGCTFAELASTFLAVAVSAERFLVVHIGDGVIGYVKNGELRVISAPDNAEFANQTTFVTSPDAASRSEEHTSELQSRENLVC